EARGAAGPARRDAGVDDRYAARSASPLAGEPEGGRRGVAAGPGARALRGGARRLASARPVRRGARATRVPRVPAPRADRDRHARLVASALAVATARAPALRTADPLSLRVRDT